MIEFLLVEGEFERTVGNQLVPLSDPSRSVHSTAASFDIVDNGLHLVFTRESFDLLNGLEYEVNRRNQDTDSPPQEDTQCPGDE